ncbi:MAG: NAD(P)-binding domain-containing protein [Phycisphaerae bacterium]
MPMQHTDVLLVGAGPIGLEMAVALKRAGVDYLHIEAEMIGRTIHKLWPRHTRFLSAPDEIAIAGVPAERPDQDRLLGEDYLSYLRNVAAMHELPIRCYERVDQLQALEDGFVAESQALDGRKSYRARKVILATGDMARPHRLGVRGEDLPHVQHGFQDPHEYFGRRVLIVGGRNSAVEAAIRMARAGAEVAISYRREALPEKHLSHKLYPIVQPMIDKGRIRLHCPTLPVEIHPGRVLLRQIDETFDPVDQPPLEVAADHVVILIGYAADVSLFRMAGVEFETPLSAPTYDPDTMETNVPGLYVAGTSASGTQVGYAFFIETAHVHVGRILRSLQEKL